MKRPKFNLMELVRIRTPGKHEKPSAQSPGTLIMGKTGTVEIAGPVSANGESMIPAYYIRIGDLPAVLIHEEWLEAA